MIPRQTRPEASAPGAGLHCFTSASARSTWSIFRAHSSVAVPGASPAITWPSRSFRIGPTPATSASAANTPVIVTPTDGERRHLTVLFCDLVNSTSIAAQLDPEDWREVIAKYHRTAAQAIERFGGHIA